MRWPTHTSQERDLYYNVIGCARQRRSRDHAHTHHRVESCPTSEAPSFFGTGSRRVMTEQGTPDARKNTPSKPKSRWLPQSHHPKAPMITRLMRIPAVRQSRHHCFSRPPPDNPSRLSQNDHLPTLGERLHIPCTDAVPHFCREPAHARFYVSARTTGERPTALWRAHRLDPATAATGLQLKKKKKNPAQVH